MPNNTLWKPSKQLVEASNLGQYTNWLKVNKSIDIVEYADLHRWSVENLEDFWMSLVEYFDIQYDGEYERVLSQKKMPGVKWFEGMKLNYVEHMFRQETDLYPAMIAWGERRELEEISWKELKQKVADYQSLFLSVGLKKGDTVAAFLPNCVEASYAFMACCSLGAIWSSCSPDFGIKSVLDRFEQIEPKIFISCDGYLYNDKVYEKTHESVEILKSLPTVELAVMVPFVGSVPIPNEFQNIHEIASSTEELVFNRVDFNDAIWVLYSSGTTGRPKAITHGHGGVLLEHLKYLSFHNDVKKGEKFFWYSTTGWMMWNFVHASMLVGATVVIYDGSPAFPSIQMLWEKTEEMGLEHFGTSAPFLVANMKKKLDIGGQHDLSKLRTIGSTGSPLPPEAYAYVYEAIKSDVWLCSMAGGTDICTAWVGSNPWLEVRSGEIQCRTLGTDMQAWNDEATSVINELGEMVVKQSMPSMPIYFWNDPNNQRYRASYFDTFPDVWRHGDWIKIDSNGSVIIYGRSDATLNRMGVRIGTAEIYRNLNDIEQIEESLIVNLEQNNGSHFMPLFVKLKGDLELNEELIKEIKTKLRQNCTSRHVPDMIYQVPDVPLTISGKLMEAPVKKILMGMTTKDSFNRDAMRNPEAMDYFFAFKK